MNTYVSGFQPFFRFRFFASFCIRHISNQQHESLIVFQVSLLLKIYHHNNQELLAANE